MPRYFFHTADGSYARDTDGTELPDHRSARKEAIKYAGSVLTHDPDLLWDGRDFRVEVTDESDLVLFTVIMLAVDSPAGSSS